MSKWKLVPEEPTGDGKPITLKHNMQRQGAARMWEVTDRQVAGLDMAAEIYRAMLAAAPKPPAGLYVVSADGTARRVEVDVVRFIRKLIADVWDGCTPDGGDIEDLAIQCGILAEVAFDPKQHDDPLCAAEPGDPWFVFSDAFRALTGEERHD